MTQRARVYVRGVFAGELVLALPRGERPVADADEVVVAFVTDHELGRPLFLEGRASAAASVEEVSRESFAARRARITAGEKPTWVRSLEALEEAEYEEWVAASSRA